MPAQRVDGATVYPDPRVAAHLLAELGGRLRVADGIVVYSPPAGAAAPILHALPPVGEADYALTPRLDALFR